MNLKLLIRAFFPNRFLRYGASIFMVASLLMQLYGFILLKTVRLKKNESSKKSEIITIDKNLTSNESLEIKNSLDFASKLLQEEIQVIGVNQPFNRGTKKALIYQIASKEYIEVEDGENYYFHYNDDGIFLLNNTNLDSPIKVTPKILNKEVSWKIEEVGSKDKSKKSKIVKLLCSPNKEDIQDLKSFFKPVKIIILDVFSQMYGDTKNKVQITFLDQKIYAEEGDILGFDGQKIQKTENHNCPCIKILSIKPQQVNVSYFDYSRYIEFEDIIDAKYKEKGFLPIIEEPKQVYIRGKNQILCTFQGKKQKLKKGDFFYLDKGKWKKIVSLEEFNCLMDYKIAAEIFVIEEIFLKDKMVFIQGKAFDKLRSGYSSINWKLDYKKEKSQKEIQAKTVHSNSPATHEQIESEHNEQPF